MNVTIALYVLAMALAVSFLLKKKYQRTITIIVAVNVVLMCHKYYSLYSGLL